jgi:Holliday junction DNA helicase RuvA
MIATLNGGLRLRNPARLIVETAEVGYEIFVPLNIYYRMPSVGAEVELEIRQIVREDAILLYGFATAPEKQAFDLLMSVQHCWSQARARCALGTVAQRSGCCDHP